MQKKKIILPLHMYYKHLIKINEVEFTPREIDVISCILNRRGSSIAPFLSIGQRSVETHIRNIRQKAGGLLGREQIIDFIEKSGKFFLIKNEYYFSLRHRVLFEEKLNTIAKKTDVKSFTCLLVYGKEEKEESSFVTYLREHLKRIGFEVKIHVNEGNTFLTHPNEIINLEQINQVLYILPENLEGSPITQINTNHLSNVIFLLHQDTLEEEAYKKLNYINMLEQENYYLSFFEILKQLPYNNFADIVEDFKQHSELINRSSEIEPLQEDLNAEKEFSSQKKRKVFLTKRKCCVLIGFIAIVSVSGMGGFIFKQGNRDKPLPIHFAAKQTAPLILSDLILPSKTTLLDRPGLIMQINSKFKNQDGIQAVALVGIGGSGKTTIARHYGHQQKANIVWEINAESQESLKSSFEQLAQNLGKTKEDEKKLREIQEIKSPREREEKIMLFVKDHLRSQSPWFLIYDNIEDFGDIQQYFPQDIKFWGRGKFILTTRNNNIQNNNKVNCIISVAELTPDEKLNLFLNIMNPSSPHHFTSRIAEIRAFLESIPPFPLDVSVAAYYLKTTNISYKEYLKKLESYSNDLSNVQENILKETGTYHKSRYSIITLSLENLIKSHKDFGELLLFVSLLDSQNIPKDLLNQYKNDVIVDNFIYHLKKYSLITSNFSDRETIPNFSIHRSTQAIALSYLTKKLNVLNKNKKTEEICNTFVDYIVDKIERRDFLQMKFLSTHCLVLLSHEHLLTNVMKASILGELGGIYAHQGFYEKAKKLLEKSLELLDIKKHPITFAHTSIYLGKIYNSLGYYEESIDLFNNTVKIYEKHSKNNMDLAKILGYLGSIYRKTGKYKKAQNLLEKSLMLYKRHVSNNHVLIPWVSGNLGHIFHEQGDYERARVLFEQNLKIYKEYFPENHVGFAIALQDLGAIQRDLGQYKNSKYLFEECLKIYKQHLSENHLYFAELLTYLGSVYIELKNYEKAKNLLEKSLIIYEKHVPENNIYLAFTLGTLGNAYKGLKNYLLAKRYLQKNLKIYEDQHGKTHIKTAYVLRDLGDVYLLEGHLEIAESFLKKAFVIFQKDKHPKIYTCLESLSDLYLKKSLVTRKQDKADTQHLKIQAMNHLRQALEIVKTHFPADSPHITRIQDKLKKLEQG